MMPQVVPAPPWPSIGSDSLSSPPNNTHASDSGGTGDTGDKLQEWSSLIGITTAIVGNILIALALNVQRYAHIRLHRERRRLRKRAKEALKRAGSDHQVASYGTVQNHDTRNGVVNLNETATSVIHGNDAIHVDHESDPLMGSFHSEASNAADDNDGDNPDKATSTYLKSPYWWIGQVLITLGEMGNFLAYGFAPASIVSPLGVVALISNCIIAPAMFHERFRHRDFWGVVIAVAGVVTVVLSAKQEETKLNPHDVWDAITTLAFEIYLGVTIFLIILLMWASPKYGKRTILIDLGLVGLFGMLLSRSSQFSLLTTAYRWIYCPRYKGCLVNAVIDSLARLHYACHLRSHLSPPSHSHHADSLRQQSSATLRLDPGHPYSICHVHTMRHYRQCGPLSRLRAHNARAGCQVCWRLSAHFLWRLPRHEWP